MCQATERHWKRFRWQCYRVRKNSVDLPSQNGTSTNLFSRYGHFEVEVLKSFPKSSPFLFLLLSYYKFGRHLPNLHTTDSLVISAQNTASPPLQDTSALEKPTSTSLFPTPASVATHLSNATSLRPPSLSCKLHYGHQNTATGKTPSGSTPALTTPYLSLSYLF